MGKTNERLDRTQQEIAHLIVTSDGYLPIRRKDWLPVRVYFGDPDCCVTHSFGEFSAREELLIGVPADWLETVLQLGLARVNGAVVLEARPWSWDDPLGVESAEEVWRAKVMMLDGSGGVKCNEQFIVRYGGETSRGKTVRHAFKWCLLNIREKLGI